ncbi:Lipoprotein-releasing system ATP-binding protein LolD [compost metagenome]
MMLQIRNLTKQFHVAGKNIKVVNIPQWTVGQGEKVAITGPSGSGKSTLLHLISGIMTPDSGEIIIGTRAIHEMKEYARDQFRADCIGYILQDFYLIPSLTARQNVEIAMRGKISSAERKDKLDHWFEKIGLHDRMHHVPSQLSRGQQQRVAMIRALIHEPTLVLADEPTGSLDAETAEEVTDLMLELCGSSKHTLLVVTHDLKMAETFPKRAHIHDINPVHAVRSGHKEREQVI